MEASLEARALEYSKFFTQVWTPSMEVVEDAFEALSAWVNGELLTDGNAIVTKLLTYAVNCSGVTSIVINVETSRYRTALFGFTEQLGRSWMFEKVVSLKVYGYDCPFPPLTDVVVASNITHLTLKSVQCHLVDVVKPLVHLTHFTYSEKGVVPPYPLDEDELGNDLHAALDNKPLIALRLSWVKVLTTYWLLTILGSLAVVNGSFVMLKVKRCNRVNMFDLGRLMRPLIRNSLQVLHVYTESLRRRSLEYGRSFAGLPRLRVVRILCEPAAVEDDCKLLVESFLVNVKSCASVGATFELGMRISTLDAPLLAMECGLIKAASTHEDKTSVMPHPFYTYAATLRGGDEPFLLRIQLH